MGHVQDSDRKIVPIIGVLLLGKVGMQRGWGLEVGILLGWG